MSGKQRIVRRQLFPEKLWDLVNKPASGIQWSPDGKRIEVERARLEKFIGTKFRSHNFDSFIRQLHFYGFRKCGNSYHHDKFQKGRPEALHLMKRKYSNLPLTPISEPPSQPKLYSSANVSAAPMSNPKPTNFCLVKANKVKSRRTILYSLKSENDLKLDLPINFSVLHECRVKYNNDNHSITFNLPENLTKASEKPSPRSLVIERKQCGDQSFITAHFIYSVSP